MNMNKPEKIDRNAWLRYLQVKGEANERLAEQMDEAETQLLECAKIRGIYRVLAAQDVPMEGYAIRKHLEGCNRVAILAVTLGNEVDALIRRYEVTDMAMALIVDSGASVLAEQAADEAERSMVEEIRSKSATEEELFFTPRFSPGYGDYPIQYQKPILACVDAGRKIGVTLTATNIMIPRKSITALVGLAAHPVTGRLASCDECLLKDKCTLKREGKHC